MTEHPKNLDLPNDLLAFLREGRQLDYDADNSAIGRIKLKRDIDLRLATITTYPGCQSIIDDPYLELEGLYQCDVCDLVAESEEYDAQGLLCWIVALKRFGCIDPEHGDVITFPDITWTDIVANPLPYLEAQWGADDNVSERALPWIHFPFKLSESRGVLTPYGSKCPVHHSPVTARQTSKPRLFGVFRRRDRDGWLQNYLTTFPNSGVPITEDELLCCTACRAAEDAWLKNIADSILPADASPNAQGWVQCPGCGIRFSTADTNVFGDAVHLTCGQKINLVP